MFSFRAFVVFSLACFVFGQVDLETEYCLTSFPGFATKQVKMTLSATEIFPTQRVISSQSFNDGTNNIGLIRYEQDGSVMLETVTSTSSATITQTSSNPIHYIDSKNEYILGREILNAAQGSVDYVLLKYQPGSVNFLKTTFIAFDTTDQNNPELWDITNILSIESDGKVIVVGYGEQRTALFEVTPSATTKNFKLYEELDANNRLDITSGNLNSVFDKQCNLVFKWNTADSTFDAQNLNTAQVSASLNPLNIQTVKLSDGVFLLESKSQTDYKIIRVDSTNGINTTPLTIIGTPNEYTDGFRNRWVSTANDFIWIRVLNKAAAHFQLSTSTLTQIQKDQLMAIVKSNIIQVGFENDLMVIIYSTGQFYTQASVATLRFTSGTSNTVAIVDNKKNVYDSTDFFPNFKLIPKFQAEVKTGYKCNCVEDEIVKIQCFNKEFKCISTTLPKRRDCSKTNTL